MLRWFNIYKIFFVLIIFLVSGLIFASFNYTYVSYFFVAGKPSDIINVTWPHENVNLFDNQVISASLSKIDTSKMRMYWEIEGGVMGGEMQNDGNSNFTSEVDTSNWDWKKDNKYILSFFVKDNEANLIASTSIFVYAGDLSGLAQKKPQDFSISSNVEVGHNAAAVSQSTPVNESPATDPNTQNFNFKVEWVSTDIKNNQKFIYHVDGYDDNEIIAFWYSDGGHKNLIYQSDSQTPFVAAINIFGWRWKEQGPYTISFAIADKKTSTVLATENFSLYWKGETGNSEIEIKSTGLTTNMLIPAQSNSNSIQSSPTLTSPITTTEKIVIPRNPATIKPIASDAEVIFTNKKLFTPEKPAVVQSLADFTNQSDVEALNFIMKQASSVWLNGDPYETDAFIQDIITKAKVKKQVPTFVLYNIPNRDCGSYSSGGTDTIENYKIWIDRVANNLTDEEVIVVVEPDALAQLNCIPAKDRAGRTEMIKYAVEKITSASDKAMVYIDAGHPHWVSADEMAARLQSVAVAKARGFALNISSYASTKDNITYGNHISNLLGGKKYVIDTSRNGKGPSPTREWCNPSGRALGDSPVLLNGTLGAIDALLWIKFPGESDGHCNGGPGAGGFWTQYAIDLYKNR